MTFIIINFRDGQRRLSEKRQRAKNMGKRVTARRV